MRWLTLLFIIGSAQAQGGINALVDRVSERVDEGLGGEIEPDEEHLRPLQRGPQDDKITIVGARWAPGGVALQLSMRDAGPRLLLVDAGLVVRGPSGADYVLVPNQRHVVQKARSQVVLEAVPLLPNKPEPAPGATLEFVRSNSAGVLAVLRTVQKIEAEDAKKLRRYLRKGPQGYEVAANVVNRESRLARWMTWTEGPDGQPAGELPRSMIMFALWAVTADGTIGDIADWLRRTRKMDMEPAIKAAWPFAQQAEYLLERAGLNYRVFSPAHVDYHLNVGLEAFRRNDLIAAKKAFKEAARLGGNDPRPQERALSQGRIRVIKLEGDAPLAQCRGVDIEAKCSVK